LAPAALHAQFAEVVPGARSVGLGGSLVATADDASAAFWNPASLAEVRQYSAFFDLNRTYQLRLLGASIFDPVRGAFGLNLWQTHLKNGERTDNGLLGWAKSLLPGFNAGVHLALSSGDSVSWFSYGLGLAWRPVPGNAGPGWLGALNRFAHSIGEDLQVGISYVGLPLGSRRCQREFRYGLSYLPVEGGPRFHLAEHLSGGDSRFSTGLEVPLGNRSAFFFGVGDWNIHKMGVGFRLHWQQLTFDVAYSAQLGRLLASFQFDLGEDPFALADRHFAQGTADLKKKKIRQALEEFEKTVTYNPEDSRAWAYYATVRRLVDQEDARLDSIYRHAEQLRQNGEFVNAALEYSKILKRNPKHEKAKRKLLALKPAVDATINQAFQTGIKLYENEDYEKARSVFERVLLIKPNHQGAQDYLERTKAILHGFAEDHFLRGLGFYRQRNLTRAYEEFAQAVNLDPDYEEAKNYLDKISAEKKTLEKKIDRLLQEGEELAKRGNAVQASIKFRKVLEVDNGNRLARKKLIELQPKVDAYIARKMREGKEAFARGRLKQARAAFRQVMAIVPTHKEASKYDEKVRREMVRRAENHYQEGMRYFQEGNYDRALQEFERALVYVPTHAGAKRMRKQTFNMIGLRELLRKAEESYAQGDYVRAMAMFTQVLENNPDNPTALEYVEKCQQRLNELAETHFNRGISFYAAEDYLSAIEEMDKTLEINPNHRGAKEYKRRAEMRLKALESLR
ncbi:MAG: tetratricopeptide repeat protein, partial [Calditrichaeota bacterium]|nr:tetratricopeptide repeat protein [Calditrichota bacterium]